VVRVRGHYPVIDFDGVQLSVQILVQPVAEHPDPLRRLLVHLQVVREAHRATRTAAQRALRARLVPVAVRVPAAHPALGHQVVVHHAFGVHRHGGRLALLVPDAPGLVERGEVFDQVAGAQRRVPQRRGGHVELVVAGHRVEVQQSVVPGVRRQAHAKDAVHPVERDAVQFVVAVQRVRIEVRVVDPPRFVLRNTNSIYN